VSACTAPEYPVVQLLLCSPAALCPRYARQLGIKSILGHPPRYPDPTLSPMGSTSRQWLVGEDFRIRTAGATPSLAHEFSGDRIPLHVETPAQCMEHP
jgi:hypothetical protein